MGDSFHKTIIFDIGSTVYHEGLPYVVSRLVDLEYLLAEEIQTGQLKKLRMAELSVDAPGTQIQPEIPLDAFSDKEMDVARSRMEIIKPLVYMEGRTSGDVQAVADRHSIHINTVYGWLRLYEPQGLLSSLIPKRRSDAGTRRLSAESETILMSCIETEYLTKQRKSVSAVYTEVRRQCRKAGISCPHPNTVRNRINQLSSDRVLKRRTSKNAVHKALHMNRGEFPHANYPLAVVQIDHTPLDIILVDDHYRLPLLRPWLTLAIDVYSRMVVGFYVSFDSPGAISVGVCLSNAILGKEKWLAEHDLSSSWPCWGLPRTVHADNAKEFRGKMLQKACDQYGITLEWRPVARPHFGAHVERLLGTFAKEIHNLPGTTFSNTTQRQGYDSEKQSALTLKEFERWLAILIVDKYHNSFHSGINTTPIALYEEGILGTESGKGIGLLPRVRDEDSLCINFLPFFERTVQAYGIQIDKVYYYHDVLRIWINSTEGNNSKRKRKFIFRRDPRDISVVWFFDPQLSTYYPIPYRNLSFPAVTIWEFRAAQNHLKDKGLSAVDEDTIFDAIEKMREIEASAVQSTKKVRKAQQKRKSSQGKALSQVVPKQPVSAYPEISRVQLDSQAMSEDDEEIILPFDEMLDIDYG